MVDNTYLPPLQGVRVLAMEQFIAAPYCTMHLADAGAEVIKIERPGTGDPRRQFHPLARNEKGEISGGFMAYNRNKKSVTLNVKEDKGKELLLELAKKSDVLVENMAPGTMSRLGLGYNVLKEINPGLVYASLSGFGQLEGYTGPYSEWPVFDPVLQAMSGIMYRIGKAQDPPMLAIAGTVDRVAALCGAYSIMLALFARSRTGMGQYVDTSMYDSSLILNEAAVYMYSFTGQILERGKDLLYSPVGSFKTSDGYVGLIIPNEAMWARFCKVIGREDLTEHPLTRGSVNRSKNYKDFLKPIVDSWMESHTTAEVVELLQAGGVPVGPVHTGEDLFNCPQVEARKMLLEIDDPVAGKKKFVSSPVKLSDWPEPPKQTAPRLGENTVEILTDVLGLAKGEIKRLESEGVI